MGSGKKKEAEFLAEQEKKEAKKEVKPKQAKPEKVDENLKYIVRIAGTDLPGTKGLLSALNKIRGVSFNFATYCLNILNLEPNRKVGSLTDEESAKIEDVLKNPMKYGIPKFALDRQKDFETGEDKHLVGADWDFQVAKKLKSYVGIRHFYGLKLRGQRTSSRGANQRGRSGKTVGVIRDKLIAAKAAATAAEAGKGAEKGKK
jgi:small subunit ribosomal protein S13